MRPSNPYRRLLGALYDGRRLILGSMLVCLILGVAYAIFTRPVYRSDILFQVEQSPGESKSNSNDPSSVFDLKTDAATEIEVLKSRRVMSRAVEDMKLYIDAVPRYVPLLGWLLAENAESLSAPLPGGYVYGTERIDVATFDVPERFYKKRFMLTVDRDGAYTLQQSGLLGAKGPELHGRVGQALHANTPNGPIDVLVRDIAAEPGARFALTRYAQAEATEWLQKTVAIAEKGKQSNMIGVTLDGTDPVKDGQILNELGDAYITQNTQRKSEEADKLIRFLDEQLRSSRRS
jgi:tyrosine-protein kinase Etk/Wzc